MNFNQLQEPELANRDSQTKAICDLGALRNSRQKVRLINKTEPKAEKNKTISPANELSV